MINYKFILAPYKERKSPKYTICPSCGKRSFVPYQHRETGEYPDPERFGRCERVNECNYQLYPNSFEPEPIPTHRPTPKPPAKPLKTYTDYQPILRRVFEKSMNRPIEGNNLFRYLRTLFPESEIKQAFDILGVGTGANGETWFWQFEPETGAILTGQILQYNPTSGRRDKNIKPKWIHSELMKLPESNPFKLVDFNPITGFFGITAVTDKDKQIAIVESAKTALILKLVGFELPAVSIQGKQNLNANRLAPLKGFELLAYPDRDGLTEWHGKCVKLIGDGFNIEVASEWADFLQSTTSAKNYDYADYLLGLPYEFLPTQKPQPTEQKNAKFLIRIEPENTKGIAKLDPTDLMNELIERLDLIPDQPPAHYKELSHRPIANPKFDIPKFDVLPTIPVKTSFGLITDPRLFVDSHTAVIEGATSARLAQPYIDRLRLFNEAIQYPKDWDDEFIEPDKKVRQMAIFEPVNH